MTVDQFAQSWICIFGGIAIWLVGTKEKEWRRWDTYLDSFHNQPGSIQHLRITNGEYF